MSSIAAFSCLRYTASDLLGPRAFRFGIGACLVALHVTLAAYNLSICFVMDRSLERALDVNTLCLILSDTTLSFCALSLVRLTF